MGRRAVHTHRYPKQVPGHYLQVDVKFLTLKRKRGGPVRRYQYTAIDFYIKPRTPQLNGKVVCAGSSRRLFADSTPWCSGMLKGGPVIALSPVSRRTGTHGAEVPAD